MSEIPTSPPDTPGQVFGADDYFTQKVFPSAVPIFDYQQGLSAVHQPLRQTIQPSSIDISIVERYIPPTNSREFTTAFDLAGPSLLIDRLIELSPHDGTLIFIYPTSTGAKTFMRSYLGPILDPVLRSMMVVNGLADDLGHRLGSMEAVDALPSFAALSAGVHGLCATLSEPEANRRLFYGPRTRLEVRYAAPAEKWLARHVWAAEWWAKQEKPRIREVVTRAVQEAQRRRATNVGNGGGSGGGNGSGNGGGYAHAERLPTATELVQEVIDGVAKKQIRPELEPRRGVEVGVFIIRRSIV